ncbi:MAG: disulfide bond formation protein B [bacterium]|nr:disulfide bond formation protein B [bacterium]
MVLLFSLLSLLALAASLGLVLMLVRSGSRTTAVIELGPYALPVAATVATVATLGSIYLSEVEGFVPCLLCWVQRGVMYPLAAFLIVVSFRPARWAAPVALLVAGLGGLVAAYHYGEQRGWVGGSEEFCDAAVPCTYVWVEQFGFMSIPFMAFSGFLLIALLAGLRMLGNPAHEAGE